MKDEMETPLECSMRRKRKRRKRRRKKKKMKTTKSEKKQTSKEGKAVRINRRALRRS